jgi:hypothetical protein
MANNPAAPTAIQKLDKVKLGILITFLKIKMLTTPIINATHHRIIFMFLNTPCHNIFDFPRIKRLFGLIISPVLRIFLLSYPIYDGLSPLY